MTTDRLPKVLLNYKPRGYRRHILFKSETGLQPISLKQKKKKKQDFLHAGEAIRWERKRVPVICRTKAKRYRDITKCQIGTVNLISEELSEGVKAFVSTHTQNGYVWCPFASFLFIISLAVLYLHHGILWRYNIKILISVEFPVKSPWYRMYLNTTMRKT
jgi:hypothetical protein